jgi:hypothetical protein
VNTPYGKSKTIHQIKSRLRRGVDITYQMRRRYVIIGQCPRLTQFWEHIANVICSDGLEMDCSQCSGCGFKSRHPKNLTIGGTVRVTTLSGSPVFNVHAERSLTLLNSPQRPRAAENTCYRAQIPCLALRIAQAKLLGRRRIPVR